MIEKASRIPVFSLMVFKSLTFSMILFGLIVAFSTFSVAQTAIPLGATLPQANRSMQDVSGRNLSLNDAAKENGLIVIFSSNTCPWVQRYQDRMLELSEIAENSDIGMVALNPNEGYRDRGDALADMERHADKAAYNFSYLLDEDHIVADAFGATKTPEVFLFNEDLELVYNGPIDDNANNANRVEKSFVVEAIQNMLSGASVKKATGRFVGCTIKRGG